MIQGIIIIFALVRVLNLQDKGINSVKRDFLFLYKCRNANVPLPSRGIG